MQDVDRYADIDSIDASTAPGTSGGQMKRLRVKPWFVWHGRRQVRAKRATGIKSWLTIWFVLPAVFLYVGVALVPAMSGVALAFTQRSSLGAPLRFVGLANFRTIFTDTVARSSFTNTLVITASICLLQNLIGLLFALALNKAFRSRNALRTLFFAPAMLSPLVVGYLWQYFYSSDGIINFILDHVGLGSLQQSWLGDEALAIWSVAATVIWQFAGYSMVIFLAGLQAIPPELNEAASLDGVGWFARFRHITWPLLAPAATINLTLSLIGGLKLFDQVLALTNGGPGYSTETLATNVYKQAFLYGDDGYATALAVVLTLVVMIATLGQLYFLRRREVQL